MHTYLTTIKNNKNNNRRDTCIYIYIYTHVSVGCVSSTSLSLSLSLSFFSLSVFFYLSLSPCPFFCLTLKGPWVWSTFLHILRGTNLLSFSKDGLCLKAILLCILMNPQDQAQVAKNCCICSWWVLNKHIPYAR